MAGKNQKYDSATKAELLAICRERGFTVSARAKKDQIIRILESREDGQSDEETAGEGRGPYEPEPKEEAASAGRKTTLWDFAHSMDGIQPRNTISAGELMGARKKAGFKSESELELAQSRDDAYSPLVGIVGGCDEEIAKSYRSDKTGEYLPYVNVGVSYKDKWILIPSYAFWDDYEAFVKRLSDKNMLLSMINHRMGSEVEFNFMFAQDENDGNGLQYYGIRLLALKKQRADTWYSRYDGHWIMNEGDTARARVVEVWPKHLILEVYGVETKLHRRDVSRRTIEDLTDTEKGGFSPGDEVAVKITGIRRQEMPEDLLGFDYPVSITASMAELEEDPNKAHFYQFKKSQTRRAFVKNITTDVRNPGGKTAYFCEVIDVPATVRCYLGGGLAAAGLAPKIGNNVRIRITKKEITAKGEYFIYGEIFRVIKDRKKNDVAFIVNKS